jgi:hypothetical protein
VIGIRVTWEKRYITLAPVATLPGLAFKLCADLAGFPWKQPVGAVAPLRTQQEKVGAETRLA